MDIEYWESLRGISPVITFIEEQSPKAQVKIQRVIGHYHEKGLALLTSQSLTKLHGYDIYELRINIQKICYRILFIIHNSISWLVHAFKKKSNGTPQREIDIAEQRRIQIISQY